MFIFQHLKQIEYNNNLILQNVIENNSIQLSKIGKYKRDVWEFQKEWRYLLLSYPLSIAEMIKFGENDPQIIINRMIDENIPNIKFIGIEINEWTFNNIEILCGPKMTDEQKQFLNDLVDKYNTNIKIEESSLKIRQG